MKNKEKKEISLLVALIPVILTVFFLFAYIVDASEVSWMPVFNDIPLFGWGKSDPQIPLILGIVFVSLTAWYLGFTWAELEKMIVNSIKTVLPAILILIVIGMVVASWIASGVVASMIYYGLYVLHPSIFLFAALIISAVVSLSIGSSWSTAATIGLALAGIAQVYYSSEFMLAATVGAIISGAYFGDKLSPLSDTTNLAPAVSGTDLFSHVKQMLVTTVPSFIIAGVLFLLVGLFNIPDSVNNDIKDMQEGIKTVFTVNPLILLIPVITIAAAVLKLPSIPVLFGGSMLGLIVAVTVQGINLPDMLEMLHYGYWISETSLDSLTASGLSESVISTVEELFDGGGGLDGMLWTISLIVCAIAYGGLLYETGILKVIISAILKPVKTIGTLSAVTILTGFVVNFLSGDQYVSISLTGSMYKEKYLETGLHPVNLSSNVETGSTITSVMVPWNTCAAYMASIFVANGFVGGVMDYVPFLWFNLINIVIAIVFAYLGIGIVKLTDEEKQILSENPDASIPLNKISIKKA